MWEHTCKQQHVEQQQMLGNERVTATAALQHAQLQQQL
jgi:hypothetical protein